MMKHKLEIIGFDLQACLDAEAAGASRIELCADPHLGGTTPSDYLIGQAVLQLIIPVFVMVRPRGGDFVYTQSEFDAMKQTVRFCKSVGCAGIVFGILTHAGHIDQTRCAELLALAGGMSCTFHRAFDEVKQPHIALEQIISLGFERILTSGQQATAMQGSTLIKDCIQQAKGRIMIMPGSGVIARNIQKLKSLTDAFEFHSSAKRTDPSTGEYLGVDTDAVKEMAAALGLV